MKQLLTKATKADFRVVYIDETCFTRKTMVDTEYNLPKQNTTIDTARLQEPTLALLNAILKERAKSITWYFPSLSTWPSSRSGWTP